MTNAYNLQSYIDRMHGKNTDFDRAYGYQCADLVRHYIEAADGWNTESYFYNPTESNGSWGDNGVLDGFLSFTQGQQSIVDKSGLDRPGNTFDVVIISDPNDWQAGDIVFFSTSHQWGHVGIRTNHNKVPGMIEVLDQNATGRGDKIWWNNYPISMFAGALRKVARVATPQPTIIQITAQAGDGISHLFKRAGRQDFGDSSVWWEFGHLNNGADRVFSGSVYNISTVRLERPQVPVAAPEPAAVTTPTQYDSDPINKGLDQLYDNTTNRADIEAAGTGFHNVNITMAEKEHFSWEELILGRIKNYLRSNLDKALIVGVLTPILIHLNNQYSVGFDSATITMITGAIATYMVAVGVATEKINK